ncbi:MAG: DUF2490 domain-containing protein [Cytophagales bacterium]|nr:DUF2490 domain-containing protein [Cytophagales bacterium]
MGRRDGISFKVINWSVKTFLTMFVCSSIHFETFSNEEPNSIREIWQEVYFFHDFGDKVYAEILFNNLYHTNIGNYDWFVEGKIKYTVRQWFEVEGMFRREFYKLDSIWTFESRPMIRFSSSMNAGIWNMRNRHRFEYRKFEFGEEQFRYRSDLRIMPVWDFTSLNLNPYIQEEIFVSFSRLNRVRSYMGIQGAKGRFEPLIYLLVQSRNFIDVWRHDLIFGIGLGIEL